MVVIKPLMNVKSIEDIGVKSMGWGLVGVKNVRTYRVDLEDFEPLTDHEMFKEFEELLRFYNKHYKSPEHVKILLYGRTKNNLISLVFIKDGDQYSVVVYDVNKSIEILRRAARFIENYGFILPLEAFV